MCNNLIHDPILDMKDFDGALATRDMVGMGMKMGRKIVGKIFFLRLKHALNAANC